MQKVFKKGQREGYEAFINGGCLHYRDPKWAYKIPVGKRARFTLLNLEDNDQVTRSLTIDLLSGDVYYEIDSHTGSGLAYYYDMNSTKVWNNRILRLLHSIRDERLKPDPEIRRAIRSLPCADWEEVLAVLPGWQEALENRYDRLFLPHEEPEQIPVPGKSEDIGIAQPVDCHEFHLLREEGRNILRYINDNIGAEFFNEDEKYERVLDAPETAWVKDRFCHAGENPEEWESIRGQMLRFLRGEAELIAG
jgi:hypothetical protein